LWKVFSPFGLAIRLKRLSRRPASRGKMKLEFIVHSHLYGNHKLAVVATRVRKSSGKDLHFKNRRSPLLVTSRVIFRAERSGAQLTTNVLEYVGRNPVRVELAALSVSMLTVCRC